MKTIVEGQERVRKLWGKQQCTDVAYRPLKYILRAECADGLLLQNVITGQVVLLTDEEASLFTGSKKVSLSTGPKEILLPLIENYFLVPEDYTEKETVVVLRKLSERLFPAAGINGYMILPTTNCNARCAYCFEQNISRASMDSETAERIIAYIEAKKGPGPINIHWFGGEPLLGIGHIDHICHLLNERNIAFDSIMTSNGYLFDESTVEKAAGLWKLKRVQITLDGTEDNYNSIKSYSHAQTSPFRRVLNNISLLLQKGIEVKLRLSLTSANACDLDKLIDELESLFKGCSHLLPYVGLVSDEFLTAYDETCEWERLSPEHIQEYQALTDRIEEIWPSKPTIDGLSVTHCMADNDGDVAIMPDGKLLKCENIVDDDQAFGSIYSDVQDPKNRLKFKEKKEFERCGNCPLYPSCILLRECIPARKINELYCKYAVEHSEKKLLYYCQNL